MSKKWKIYFVPHSHWDKEWYFTKEASNVFLIENLKKLKEIADHHQDRFSHHVFDSQLSIVDDYLAFYPEDEKKINQLIQDKRLIVGPWYSQPDMFSTSGESILRNLSYAKHYAMKRGFSAKNAYTPDSFGFNANLPQILKHTDCDGIIQWRGVDSNHLEHSVFNIWKGIDGSETYLYNMFKYGYGLTFWAFSKVYQKWDKEKMPQLAQEYLTELKEKRHDLKDLKEMNKNTGNILLFPFGSDQSPVIEWLPLFIQELNKIDEENEWILADYDDFFQEIIKKNKNVKTITGELKYGQYSRTHRTIGSSRYDIKKLSREAEYMLYNVSEPLGLIYQQFTRQYSTRVFEKALRMLLECHAHDSLGGSCTDVTNQEVVDRLNKVLLMLESQNTLMKRRIAEFLKLEKNDFLIFNLLPYPRKINNEVKILSKSKKFDLIINGNKLDYEILGCTYYDRTNFINSHHSHLKDDESEKGFYLTTINLKTPIIEGLSYQILQVVEDEKNPFKKQLIAVEKKTKIKNEKYEVEVKNNGELVVKDSLIGEEFKFGFEIQSDAGDTYDFSPKLKQTPILKGKTLKTILSQQKNSQTFDVDLTFAVYESLTSGKLINQPVNLKVILINQQIKFEITMNNLAKDIRWRFVFKTNNSHQLSYADQAGALISRPVEEEKRMKIWSEQNWKDMPVAIENMQSFVYLKHQKNKYGFLTKGINEYEVTGPKFDQLAITLFRGVSLMGRRNLLYRPGRASGINDFACETPQSNLLENLKFEFIFFSKKVDEELNCQEQITGYDYFQNQNFSDYIWMGKTFWKPIVNQIGQPQPLNLFLKNPHLNVTAIKQGYDESEIIIRLMNTSQQEIDLSKFINPILKVQECNGLELQATKLKLKMRANEIKTIKLVGINSKV